jgi:hypothetical protein
VSYWLLGLFGSFAAHTEGQIRDTMQEVIEKIIADAEVMPNGI